MNITAIIVARSGSKRIKNKNLLKLNGETLFERKINQLKQSKHITDIAFGSDSQEMLDMASLLGATVYKRDDFHCNEEVASANDMIRDMVNKIKPCDIVVWAHCTNPLITAETYDKAIETFLENYPTYDSLLSVVELKEHLWKSDKSAPLNYNPYAGRHVPAKELPPYYMQDGGIFIQHHKSFLENSYFFGKKPFLFEIDKTQFLDINELNDYQLAKIIAERES